MQPRHSVVALLQVEVTGDGSDDEFFDAEERELASVSSRRSLSSQLSSRSSYYEASSQPASPSALSASGPLASPRPLHACLVACAEQLQHFKGTGCSSHFSPTEGPRAVLVYSRQTRRAGRQGRRGARGMGAGLQHLAADVAAVPRD